MAQTIENFGGHLWTMNAATVVLITEYHGRTNGPMGHEARPGVRDELASISSLIYVWIMTKIKLFILNKNLTTTINAIKSISFL